MEPGLRNWSLTTYQANLQMLQAGAQVWSGMGRRVNRPIRRSRRFSIFQPKILRFLSQITSQRVGKKRQMWADSESKGGKLA